LGAFGFAAECEFAERPAGRLALLCFRFVSFPNIQPVLHPAKAASPGNSAGRAVEVIRHDGNGGEKHDAENEQKAF